MQVVYGRTTGYLVELKYCILFHTYFISQWDNSRWPISTPLVNRIILLCGNNIFFLFSLSVASDYTITFDKNNQGVFVITEKYI